MSALYIQKKGIKQHTGSATLVLDGGSNDFKLASYKRVCEDHFEVSCFLYDIQARLMGYQEKKWMTAVPKEQKNAHRNRWIIFDYTVRSHLNIYD